MANCLCFPNNTSSSDLNCSESRKLCGRMAFRSSRRTSLDICGHGFKIKTFIQPRFCSQCHAFIWGFARNGYQCKGCDLVIHKRCFDKTLPVCKRAEDALPRLTWEQFMSIWNYANLFQSDTLRNRKVEAVPLTS